MATFIATPHIPGVTLPPWAPDHNHAGEFKNRLPLHGEKDVMLVTPSGSQYNCGVNEMLELMNLAPRLSRSHRRGTVANSTSY